jgi:uncharacterized protein (DUF924 family)
MEYQIVLDFWFKEIDHKYWFVKDLAFDKLLKDKFEALHTEVSAELKSDWRSTPQGRLAEIIVLDQFSRNMFRDSPKAFAQDPLALRLAQEAVALRVDKEMSTDEKSFLYMPYMHSESRLVHLEALRLFSQPGLEDNLKFEILHKAIIDKYGRYPHRNKVLNRESTPEEIEFLRGPGSSF